MTAQNEENTTFNVDEAKQQNVKARFGKQLTHTRSCAGLNPTEDCTCCLKERIEAQDYLTLLTAWQKRCTESEAQLSESQKREADLTQQVNDLLDDIQQRDEVEQSQSKLIEDLRTRLSGQTCYVPPEFQAEMDELKKKLAEQQAAFERYGTKAIIEIAMQDAAIKKIDALRNDIITRQTIGWSAHVYPLVAILDEYLSATPQSVEAFLNGVRVEALEEAANCWKDCVDKGVVRLAPMDVIGWLRRMAQELKEKTK